MTVELSDPLIWVDLEMTGLDPETDLVLEIAVIVTDGNLEHAIEGPELVLRAPDDVLATMAPIVVEMHTESGLIDGVRSSNVSAAEAEKAVLAFLDDLVGEPGSAPLAGNSVHADRAFLAKHMPQLEAFAHYRNVDVSTIKELAKRWNPSIVESAPEKGGSHRALADIRESIDELRYYREAFFVDPGPVESGLVDPD